MMIYDDLGLFMTTFVICDELQWFMMIYDDLWWFMMIYDDDDDDDGDDDDDDDGSIFWDLHKCQCRDVPLPCYR